MQLFSVVVVHAIRNFCYNFLARILRQNFLKIYSEAIIPTGVAWVRKFSPFRQSILGFCGIIFLSV